jgi:tetratricopeptide (TPR) repeat protein
MRRSPDDARQVKEDDPMRRAEWRPGALAFLMAGLAVVAMGGEPDHIDRVGQRVVARSGGLTLRDDRDAIAGVGDKGRAYRVERVDGRRIWLRAEGKDLGGWSTADEVVAVDPSDDPPARPVGTRPRAGFGPVLRDSLRHADSHVRLRHAYAAAGRRDYDRAIAECTAAIRMDPRSAEAYNLRGSIWAAMGRLDQALIDLDEAIRLSPRNPSAMLARGEVRLALGEPGKAIADLDEAIRLGYRDAMAYYDRGEARLRRGELDPALADLDEAIRRDPQLAIAYVHRARIRGKKDEPDKSLADLNEAIRLDPRNESAYDRLAWLRATCPDARYRDGRRAVEAATRACELTGWKDANHLGSLAAACAEASDFDAAVRWQKRANELYPGDKDRSDGEARLKLYQAGAPFREAKP